MTSTILGITAESTSRFVQVDEHRIHLHQHGAGRDPTPARPAARRGPGASDWSNSSQNVPGLAEE